MQSDSNGGNRPYAFIALDLHWILWVAFANICLPSIAYYYNSAISTTASQLRIDAVTNLMYIHLAVWTPLLLLAMLPGAVPAFYLEHISSNANPTAYIAGGFILSNMYYREQNNSAILMFWAYFGYAQYVRYVEKMRSTFAMYYLNPKLDTLDSNLHPSIQYFLGWREHRYRYYHYFPETTPNFDL